MRAALFWVFYVGGSGQFLADVSGQTIGFILTPENGTI